MTSPDPYSTWDAAYVLGSLSAAERRDFEHHLPGCAACRGHVAELSGIPGLLSLARRDAADTEPAETSVLTPLYAGLAAKVARRRGWFVLAGAAAALVLAGTTAAITTAVTSSTAPPSSEITSAAAAVPLAFSGNMAQGLSATGQLLGMPWGTLISWHCSYAAGSVYGGGVGQQRYVLVLISTSGAESAVASWTAGPGSEVNPTATTSTPVGEIARIEIRDGTGTALLSASP